MIAYRFTLSERELELVLSALGLTVEAWASDDDADTEEMRALLVRLDVAADEQYLEQGAHKQ